nr:WW domain-containing adapter protein with coiled-coil homolog [Ciona intestinalis]XP_026691841.1 WW domain-containing adapter protein with coiled-coil homolog [Ciona intestinalis]|eukprot:XP_009859538.1 WW domain-containing adapter protein with coiled-coil homolog [Ciona intestinalis]
MKTAMYGRSVSQIDGYREQATKPSVHQHNNNRHSVPSKDRDRRKNEMTHSKQKHLQANKVTANHTSKTNSTKHQKGALRSCGSWSEHVSSSGKIYYYNSKNEVSQWEKPKDWNDSKVVDLRSHDKSKSSQRASSGGNPLVNRSTSKPGSSDVEYRGSRSNQDRDYRNKSDRDYRDVDYRDNQAKDVRRVTSVDKDYRPRDHTTTSTGSNGHPLTHGKDSYIPSTGEFYDYSTWGGRTSNTPLVNGVSSTENTQSSQQPQDGDKATTVTVETSESKPEEESATSAFVRTLSNVLTQASNKSTDAEGNLKNALQLLLNAASKSQTETTEPENGNHESTTETNTTDPPPNKRPRVSSDDTKKDTGEPPEVIPTFPHLEELQKVFDPNLTTHAQGWSTEPAEKQCNRLTEDYHKFIADHMTNLNAQMTTARSKVRASEILSTLQEQRILYLRQQISDLEKNSTTTTPFT